MNPERWKQIDELLSATLDLDEEKRAAFLDQACDGDTELKKEVESLLASEVKEPADIEGYPIELAADLLEAHPRVFTSGNLIGPYKILSLLGSGGMGEVYRASDPRIGRDVAVKILGPRFSQDPDRVRRFEQEARAAGALSHPNIVALFDAGMDNGSPYLVSELLRGEILQQKLNRHPLPIRKAVEYAHQIAKGLSAAHEKGIVHRDLKPGNIFITTEGRVKILDFGLAKLTHPDLSASEFPMQEKIEQITETGMVMGTVVYMSPEQVSGKKVDHRSDIFAFGAVFYEMLYGKRPFRGETQIEVMHAILKADPPELAESSGMIPLSLERIVRRCLEKDVNDRFQTASDLAFAIETMSTSSGTAVAYKQKKSIPIAWILSAIFFLAAVIFGTAFYRSMKKSSPGISSVQRLSIVLPENTVLNSLAISPDGQRLVYITNGTTGFSEMWLRSMDSEHAEKILEDATLPFWSPDSRSIGFFTETELKKLTIGGGPPETLTAVNIPKGGTWNQYGDILFNPNNIEGLYRISAAGGEARLVTTLDRSRGERRHLFPHFLPDGRHFLYMIMSSEDDQRGVYLGSINSGLKKRVLPDAMQARFVDPGYLFFAWEGKLMVQHFDKTRFELSGEPVAIADDSSEWGTGPDFSVSQNNILVRGNFDGWKSQITWFDRSGKQSSPLKSAPSTIGLPAENDFCDLSSDDKRLLAFRDGRMWMIDLINGTFDRYAVTNDEFAIFSPDGSEVAYSVFSMNSEHNSFFKRLSSGAGKAELLFRPPNLMWDPRWSKDGKFITYTSTDPSWDLFAVPITGDRKPFKYLESDAREENGVLSPDARWMAYQSYASGQSEVYVRSFPLEAGGTWEISKDGGEQPLWRSDGKEIFYLTLDKKLIATELQTDPIFKPGASRILFQTKVHPRMNTRVLNRPKQYLVSANGTHFLVNSLVDNTSPAKMSVVLNWQGLLK
jgi:eukaryotic-like serine/threonine-protein kinase